ncbi:WD40-repeat-containing domain protein [Pelagophyceae sp. CCMP2097]|nr:WD40-repeat-containing domain protein [Pelagophyceae sp. CCMP2097]
MPSKRGQEGLQETVWSVDYSGDGSRFATGSHDGTALVWDAVKLVPSAALDHRDKGHSCYVLSVAFSTDGRRVLTTSSDKSAKLWDVEIKGMNAEDALSAGIVDEKGT